MFPANAYVIRLAGEQDRDAVHRLAELDSQHPLLEPVLIGEIHGRPAAAISLTDGRVVADPFQATMHLTPILHVRADALRAYSQTPSLRVRLLAGLPVRRISAGPAT
jgi:hypothetical protein